MNIHQPTSSTAWIGFIAFFLLLVLIYPPILGVLVGAVVPVLLYLLLRKLLS